MKPADAYQEALSQCRAVAREEFKIAKDTVKEVASLLETISSKVMSTSRSRKTTGAALEESSSMMSDLQNRLFDLIHSGLASTTRTLEQKSFQLDHFTVTLFGRTMAGKSTLREALTRGDGGTIGKGDQRTTRDVIEYTWESLRLVDTPGIGAYEGGVDRDLAVSILEESDLVFFLLSSDGIQEETFKGMQALRERNKPVIFVLNVKENLQNAVLRKRFLRDPQALFSDLNLGGHYGRIRILAGEWLGMKEVLILPIHAQAAFLATRSDAAEEAQRLHLASRVDKLQAALVEEVLKRGCVRRLQTIIDGTINDIQDLQTELRDQSKAVRQAAKTLKGKFDEVDLWLDHFIQTIPTNIDHETRKVFQPLLEGVSTFVDDNLEHADFGERWQKKVDGRKIPAWIARQQEQIRDELLARLAEFHREAQLEASLTSELPIGAPETYDPFDTKRTLRWTSAAGGVGVAASVAIIALELGSTQFWNPVGWVCLGVSLVAGVFAWFSDSREKKLQKQKYKVSEDLRAKVEQLRAKSAESLTAWFNEAVIEQAAKDLRRDTRTLIANLYGLSNVLEEGSKSIGRNLQDLNHRLMVRACGFQGLELPAKVIGSIARDPGNRTKLVWKGTEEPTFRAKIGRILGEWVDSIPEGPVEGMVAAALRPARINADQVSVKDGRATVKVPAGELGKAFGRGKINLILASRLLDLTIFLEQE